MTEPIPATVNHHTETVEAPSEAKLAFRRYERSEIGLHDLYAANRDSSILNEKLRAGEIARELAFTTGETSMDDARQHFVDVVRSEDADAKPYLLFQGLLFLAQLPADEHMARTRQLPGKNLAAKVLENTIATGFSAISLLEQFNNLSDRKSSQKIRGFISKLATLSLLQDHFLRDREVTLFPQLSLFTETISHRDDPTSRASNITLLEHKDNDLKTTKRVRVSAHSQAERLKPKISPDSNVVPVILSDDAGINEIQSISGSAIVQELHARDHTAPSTTRDVLAIRLAKRRQRLRAKIFDIDQA